MSADSSTSPRTRTSPVRLWLVLLALVTSTVLLYLPATRFGFIALDDAEYVADNPHVLTGLSWANTRWAFTTVHACNWHPLTWLSHQLDASLFTPGPTAPHVTNLALHAANAAFLLLLLCRLTSSLWRSAAVAALFALHPLRIESVAWISERKDVLSAFFFLLTLYSYFEYTKPAPHTRRTSWYASSLILFTLGLLSKPMLVTLPCVLLLLDFWPLSRRPSRALLLEKLPFLFLSLGSCIATYYAQHHGGAIRSLTTFTFLQRLENTAVAYAQYLGKTVWPVNLAVYYPHPGHWPVSITLAALLLLLAITFFILRRSATHPFASVGWFWFLGMLIPVIGLVQVGDQSIADRYTYLPSIGLFILLVWSATATIKRLPLIIATSLALLLLVILTATHLPHWQNSETLFRHTLAVTSNNFAAHHSLGYTLLTNGRTDEAIAEFQKALVLRPRFPEAFTNLGNAYLQKQKPESAIEHYESALALNPNLAQARYNLGTTLLQLNQIDKAIVTLTLAVTAQPASVWAHINLGNAFLQKGDVTQAITQYQNATSLQPNLADAHDNLGVALQQANRSDEALQHFDTAVTLNPNHANAHVHLAFAHLAQRRVSTAIPHLQAALQLQPNDLQTVTSLAWILATCPDASFRNGPRAVSLAEHAVQIANSDNAFLLQTLAAAQAENNQFTSAIATVKKALLLAAQLPNRNLHTALQVHLAAYEAGSPLRDASLQP